ncbi:helix-turn-helix transcriptional regulator [Curtobacterium sp. Csp1]|uniref:helix-turn-helix domain-containing protein n=1 Tax=unclassified Curtobacterium TaxID=257496 RepID=UPI0015989D37|nr:MULTISPECIES: helix-turn-helix transcriptional regulator [unclassified Curtobacterium]QKS13211.1 helix-turn-helix transcriptional regulator [Curtobacterium sp. csp3]QKS19452.1 helix-turn-helix transcriptional regulator [Curtobacterium sp. Csp1]
MSYELLAERTGLHRLTVLRMLRGHRGGSLESWWRMATALDADFAAMVRLLDEA